MAAKKKEEYKQQITDSLLKALAELNTEKLINSDPGLKEMSDRWDKADDLNVQTYDNYKSGNYLEGIELAQTAYSLVFLRIKITLVLKLVN